MDNKEDVFVGVSDIFKGVTVGPDNLPEDKDEFERRLTYSLKKWKEEGKRGIWIKIPPARAYLIDFAVKSGFVFHHAQPAYLMLTTWLAPEINKLPTYASHFVGCGGIVLNDKEEISHFEQVLLITEKEHPNKWKIPGGLLEAGEDISEAVIREVWEETGVNATFEGILGFRHTHNYQFERGDMYFICLLRATSSDIKIDPLEIAYSKWLPLSDFVQLSTFSTQQAASRLAWEYVKNAYQGWKAVPVAKHFSQTGNNLIYHSSKANMDDLCNK